MNSPSLLARLPMALVVLCVLVPGPAASQLGVPEVRNVRFEGNEAFPADSLAWAIVSRETQCRSSVLQPLCWLGVDWAEQKHYLSSRVIPLDQLRLQIWYSRRGYREARVDTATTARDDGKVELLFRITEGRPVLVDTIDIMGAENVDVPRLLDDLPLELGDPLSDLLLQATQRTLQQRLRNEGYAHAEVLKSFRIPSATPYRAEVIFDVAPGPRSRYGHVEVIPTGKDGGPPSLSQSDVLKILQFRSGDLFRESQLYDAQARLYGLELIRSASVERLESADSVVPIRVTVQEGDVHRVRAGGGWSSAECFDVESRWVSRNFRGGGRRVQVRGRISNILAPQFHEILCQDLDEKTFQKLNWLLAVDFAQPWVFSTRNSFSASLFTERLSYPDAFVREAVGLSMALTRNIGPRTPLTLSYRPEVSSLDAAEVLLCVSFLVCTTDDIERLQGANWLSPVGISFTRNAANNILNPTRGYTTSLDIEHAAPWTGSDFRYDRVIGDATWYEQVAPTSIFAVRLRAGWAGSGAFGDLGRGEAQGIHPQKQFYAGGANSVRGFAQNRLGPLVLTTPDPRLLLRPAPDGAGCTAQELMSLECDAGSLDDGAFLPRATGGTRVLEGSVEVRFAMASRLQGAAFADFGQVWGDGDELSLESVEFTPGVGVRVLSPIGPLRMDVAYRFRGGRDVPVLASQIRGYVAGQDRPDDRITLEGEPIPFVTTGELVRLDPLVFFGDSQALSFSRFQLHISIGQAF